MIDRRHPVERMIVEAETVKITRLDVGDWFYLPQSVHVIGRIKEFKPGSVVVQISRKVWTRGKHRRKELRYREEEWSVAMHVTVLEAL